MRRIIVYISGHGYGHAAQTLPVLDALWDRHGPLDVTFRTSVPAAFFAARYHHPFNVDPAAFDFGMAMNSAIDVDAAASAARYQTLHRQWPQLVDDESRYLRGKKASLVITNVGYVGLAAAARANIPAVAMSSLNWYDIYSHYCGTFPEAGAILAQIKEAYLSARFFVRMAPAMPMAWLPQRHEVGPVTRLGRSHRSQLESTFDLPANERLVLVSLGGINSHLNVASWPHYHGVRWLVPQEWATRRDDTIAFPLPDLSFNALLCSADVLVTKPGYGSFVEAGCNGIPVVYVPRGDWPEEPYLTNWLHTNGRAVAIDRQTLSSGALDEAIRAATALPAPPPPIPTGGAEAADLIAGIGTDH